MKVYALAIRHCSCNITANPPLTSMMDGKEKKRKSIPSAAEAEVLIRSRRRCCLCFFWEKDLTRKDGQIAHIDRNRANNARDNLAFLCQPHHNEYDRRNSQVKNISKEELRHAQSLLYEAMDNEEKPPWIATLTFGKHQHVMSSTEEKEVLALMEQILQRRVQIHEKRLGSVVLSFELKQHEAARLFAAIAVGKFDKFELLGASVEEAPQTGRAQPQVQRWESLTKTVVELDLVNYGTVSGSLEQGLDARSVFQLNQQIQGFIDEGLRACGATREKVVVTTGDGAILVFDTADEAHRFAQAVHVATRKHNQARQSPLAKRVFRIGAATGELTILPKALGGVDIAGSAIARAVRLESKAAPGSILVDEATFERLPENQRSAYGPKAFVAGKRSGEEYAAYSCEMNPDAKYDAASLNESEGGSARSPTVLTQLAFRSGAADLDWLSIPEREWTGTPGALLRADHAIVPFHGRESEMADYRRWCLDDTETNVRLLTGSGGMGKTRFARELCLQLKPEGVACGFLDLNKAEKCVTFLATSSNEPMLLVVDYAEAEETKITEIVRIAARRNRSALRVLLLARGAGFWWSRLRRTVGDNLPSAPDKIRPLALNLDARRRSYQLAKRVFAERLGATGGLPDPTDFSAQFYERSLLLHMSALLSVQNHQARGMDSILEAVLAREMNYWSKQLHYRQLPSLLEPGFARAMGVMSAYGGVRDKREAIEMLGRIRFFNGQPQAVIEAVADVLHDCYGGANWIEPLQPDLLVEYLIARATEDDPSDFEALILPKTR